MRWSSFWLAVLLLSVGAAGHAKTVVDDAALADESDGTNWLGFGRTYSEKRFSPLREVNQETVSRLGLQWYLDLPEDRTLVSTPLAVDGVLYFTASYSKTRAVDARTGNVLWEYDPESTRHAGDRLQNMWDTSRGLAYWKGKVIIATIDGRLVALDAKNGKRLWETMTVDPKGALYITDAPKVFRDKVLIGNGGTEHTAARGYVTAYDVNTGEQVWRWWVVPGNPADGFENKAMEMAAKTWTGDWWRYGGGGNVWHGITYDPEFNQIIMGTGNGTPWNRKIRSPGGGDNLFLCALVALDADTGEYKWHYQTTPGETWDYNSTQDVVLADLEIGGRSVKALMHAPKNGFFYVIDRSNGKLLSAEKIGKVTWASHIDLETGRPVENPAARYEDGEELVWPSAIGVHNWHAMSYNPMTGLAYMPTIEMPGLFSDKGIDLKAWQSKDFRMRFGVSFEGDTPEDYGSATLLAWDPVKQKKAWSVVLPPSWNAGTLTTAGGLVFQGQADGDFVAYDAANGKELWSVNAGLGISAPSVTYEVDGKQYLSLLVGWGGGGTIFGSHAAQHGWAYRAHPRRLLTFALDGKEPMPPSPPPVFAKPLDNPDLEIDEKLASEGAEVWVESCTWCHGGAAVAGGTAPDLRASPIALQYDSFHAMVRNGILEKGMPRFRGHSDLEIQQLYFYVRREARKATQPLEQARVD
jgi:quinohemoprotein ethanol dehydrogenase